MTDINEHNKQEDVAWLLSAFALVHKLPRQTKITFIREIGEHNRHETSELHYI